MRLVIDMQCTQSESRFRGIGRYAIGLAKAIVVAFRDRPGDELYLFVNESMEETATALRLAFANDLPPGRIRGFRSVGDVAGWSPLNDERRGTSEVIREAALAALRPDAVLVMSLFEGYGGGPVTSVHGFVDHLPTATILYDLIPLLLPDTYLSDPTTLAWYERKIASLRQADLVLAISETAHQQARTVIDLPAERVATIGTGLDAAFVEPPVDDATFERLAARIGLQSKAILYAGGFDRRKNLDVLIAGYGRLDRTLRAQRRLVLVGHCTPGDQRRLVDEIVRCGLDRAEVIFTGYVSNDELVSLYQHCELFVFPSTHEGFGLPALEAMSCGAPVLAVDTPAMRELQPRPDLLVGHGVDALRAGLERVLGDRAALDELRVADPSFGARFAWKRVAQRALEHIDRLAATKGPDAPMDRAALLDRKLPRLAMLAPLPPATSGIADYCAELIPALQQFYAIELVVDQFDVDTSWIPEWIPLRSVPWFESHAAEFDRVLYHFGNSPFHASMAELLERVPGVVVLHDFFLGDLQYFRHNQNGDHTFFERIVAHAHGPAGQLLAHEQKVGRVLADLPCNLGILEAADSVIVHSVHARDLATSWYGSSIGRKHVSIPFPRAQVRLPERHHARVALGIEPDETLICSFGLIGPHKLNDLLIDALDRLEERVASRMRLVFVGANVPSVYGSAIASRASSAGPTRVDITGHLSIAEYRGYLAAADIVVQLRGASRGETSAAVFDALGAGVALIVNRHGSLAELPADSVVMLPERVTAEDLEQALLRLARNPGERHALGTRGRQFVRERHDPHAVAALYASAIESAVRFSPRRSAERLERVAIEWAAATPREPWLTAAMAHAATAANRPSTKPRVFVDVTAIADFDLKTGIQRTVRALLLAMLRDEPKAFRIEPVRADVVHRVYRYAGPYLSTLIESPVTEGRDGVVELQPGDVFLGLDLAGEAVTLMPDWFRVQADHGARIVFVAYDLLPVRMPAFFPVGMDLAFSQWLQTLGKVAHQVFCISQAVADDLLDWVETHAPLRRGPLRIASFHLGADLGASAPTRGLPPEADRVLDAIRSRPSFLMVGTVEPRKGHAQVLEAFQALWTNARDVGLVIVGKAGWMMDPFLEEVARHPEFGKRLFWLERISDEFLDQLYPACTALIAASRGEGFGLPLIESARHGLPIIARDLPVFREVAGEHAFYFDGLSGDDLAAAVVAWLALREAGAAPSPEGIAFYSWKESAQQLLALLADPLCGRSWEGETRIELGETLSFMSVKLDWEGWSTMEAGHRWSDGTRSRIGFHMPHGQRLPQSVEMQLSTFDRQAIRLSMNGKPMYDATVALADTVLRFTIPMDSIVAGQQNWLEFHVPGARSPGGSDLRRLGVCMKWLRFE